MFDRKKHGWRVTLGNEQTGATVTHEIHNFWDPERIDTPDAIKATAAAEAFIATRQRHVPVEVVAL